MFFFSPTSVSFPLAYSPHVTNNKYYIRQKWIVNVSISVRNFMLMNKKERNSRCNSISSENKKKTRNLNILRVSNSIWPCCCYPYLSICYCVTISSCESHYAKMNKWNKSRNKKSVSLLTAVKVNLTSLDLDKISHRINIACSKNFRAFVAYSFYCVVLFERAAHSGWLWLVRPSIFDRMQF